MSSTSTSEKKRCESCLQYMEIYITCSQCDAAYHIYCWKNVPGAYVNQTGQLFCCPSLTSNYIGMETNFGTQDNPPERTVQKEIIDGYNEDLENCPIKEENFEWKELKCDARFLEITNKEHLEYHYSECPNKEGESIQELKKEKDFGNCLYKERSLEWSEFRCDTCLLEFRNKEHLKNHFSECPNKKEESIQELNEDKDLENSLHKEEDLKWNEFQCDACLLEFMDEEHLETHYSECPNKKGKSIQELIDDKDFKNRLPEGENSEQDEFNRDHLENHCSGCPNKQGGSVPGLNNDKDGLFCSFHNEENFQKESYQQHMKGCDIESGYSRLNNDNDICITNAESNPAQVDGTEKMCKCTVCNCFTHVKKGVVKGMRIDNSVTLFKCDMCDYMSTESETLNSHFLSKHYDGKRKYGSRICAFSTPSEDLFDSHRQIYSNERPFKCGWCDYAAAQKVHLTMHIKSKHSNADRMYKCADCKYSAHSKSSLVIHVRTHTNEKPFKCDMCDHTTVSKSYLKRHAFVKHSIGDKEYKCRYCEYSTYRKDFLVSHLRTHTNEKPFKCDMCDYAAAQKCNLQAHVLTKHSNADKKYKCIDCEYSTYTKKNLGRHMRTHTTEKPFKCDMCDYVAAQKKTLDVHTLTKHSNADKEYKCRDCGYSTHIKASLARHIHRNTTEKPLICDLCDYATAKKCNLNIHVLEKHSNADKEYKCRDCEYSTHIKGHLVNHIRTHTNEKPFKCNICKYAAALKVTLKRHILVKHSNTDKQHKCVDCKYSTYRKELLVNHIRIHANENPFKCDMCDYIAATKTALKRHILLKHSNADKKYKCSLSDCKYSTHIKEHLVYHIRTHTDEKPFKCEMCDYAAIRKQALTRHILVKHSNAEKIYKCRDCEYSAHRKEHLLRHKRIHTNENPLKCDV